MTKKHLTKLLNSDYRKTILSSKCRIKQSYIDEYAKQLIDEHLNAKDSSEDKRTCPGLMAFEVIRENGIEPIFMECGCVNHFLYKEDIEAAKEVVQCILRMILNEDKTVISFINR